MRKVTICLVLAFASFLIAIGSFFTHDVAAYHKWMSTNGPRMMERFHPGDRNHMGRGPEDRHGPGEHERRSEGDHMKDRGPHMSDEMAGNNAGGNNSPSAVNS